MNPEYRVLRLNQRRRKELFSSSRSRWFLVCLYKSGTDDYYFASSRRRSERRNNNYKSTSRRSQGVCETCRLAGNNKRRLRPSKPSSLTLEGDRKPLLSVETDVFFALPSFFRMSRVFLVFFSFLFATSPSRCEG